jgi:N-acetylneuraminate synthase
MLGKIDFLNEVASEKKYTFISTGMSTIEEIDNVVDIYNKQNCPFELMHCNSTYPIKNDEAFLGMLKSLQTRYKCRIGYSGHETGRIVSFAACVLGATSLERHITLDRAMYGSDQAASLAVEDMISLVRDVRAIPVIVGDGIKTITTKESEIRKKLRYYE